MTGKDLILYILQNDLENELVLKDGIFIGFMTKEEAAAKFDVGVYTIICWYLEGKIDGTVIGGTLYFLRDVEDPRRKDAENE